VSTSNDKKNYHNPSGMQICVVEDTFVCAADSSCFVCAQTAVALCVLQTAVASLQSPDCDTEWLICINVAAGVVCVEKDL
jgi:hypothetical protein